MSTVAGITGIHDKKNGFLLLAQKAHFFSTAQTVFFVPAPAVEFTRSQTGGRGARSRRRESAQSERGAGVAGRRVLAAGREAGICGCLRCPLRHGSSFPPSFAPGSDLEGVAASLTFARWAPCGLGHGCSFSSWKLLGEWEVSVHWASCSFVSSQAVLKGAGGLLPSARLSGG